MQTINRGDQIKMISANSTTQHVIEQYGTVLDIDANGLVLKVTTDDGPALTWIVNGDNTQVVKTAHENAKQVEPR